MVIAKEVTDRDLVCLPILFGNRHMKRLDGVSDPRRQQAKHKIRVVQLEQDFVRERMHAEQHSTAVRAAEERLADKR
jgi:hypothetical protein